MWPEIKHKYIRKTDTQWTETLIAMQFNTNLCKNLLDKADHKEITKQCCISPSGSMNNNIVK